jgi:hypothetical protein
MAARLSVIRQRLLRTLACIGLAGALAACSSQPDSLRIGEILFQQISGIGGSEDVPRSQVAAIPYATLGVRLDSGTEAMFVLQSKSGAVLQWVGGTQFGIATRDGRILRTTGFVHNLSGFLDETPPAGQNPSASRDYRYDLADLNAYGIAVHCTQRDVGQEQIVILGETHAARHVIEDCTAPELDWNFSDEFWKDVATDFVWRSVQYVHPGLDPITLETLRPAG